MIKQSFLLHFRTFSLLALLSANTYRIFHVMIPDAGREMQVGSYLKVPQCPIWVVGSSSHFSVLFSLDRCGACMCAVVM